MPASFGSRVWVWHLGSANWTYQHQVLKHTSVMGEVRVTNCDEWPLCLWTQCAGLLLSTVQGEASGAQ